MMIVAAARALERRRVCFVGIGPPNLACSLAKALVEPDLVLVYESGVVGAAPARLPLSIGDPTLVTGALGVMPMVDLFAYVLQGGRVDVAFLGAAQIDARGNINTTVIGSYTEPRVRLPGSGGACEIAINARETFAILPQSERTFVERVDFVTSPGHPPNGRPPRWGRGPSFVVTQLGTYGFTEGGEMELRSLHPGVVLDDVLAASGFAMQVSDDVAETPPPTVTELETLRQLDREGAYLT
jgi:glutaconate CoA-transferase, subunit B